MSKILTVEPDPASQTCGYQIQVGSWHNDGQKFCGEPKARGLYSCNTHHQHVLDHYGEIPMAPGNAIGR